jgi:hypothetical protein
MCDGSINEHVKEQAMKIRKYIAAIAVLGILFGCGSEMVNYRELDTGVARNLELYISPQSGSRSVTQINYAVTGLSLRLISIDPAWITNFYWQADSGVNSYSINAQNSGQYTLEITHHGINGTEPVSVQETFNFEIVPMTITRLVIVPGQIGMIDVSTTIVAPTNGTNPTNTYTNVLPATNTTVIYTNEPPATNTTVIYTNVLPATNTTIIYTNEPPATNTTIIYTNEPPATNTTVIYTNEPPATNYTP